MVQQSHYPSKLKSPLLHPCLKWLPTYLVLQSLDNNCSTGACGGSDFLEDTRYKLPSGKILNGVQAMLANRMQQLRNGLGFDVYISSTELDREPLAFVTLIRECQQSVNKGGD